VEGDCVLANVGYFALVVTFLVALYGARTDVAGMTVPDAITYTGLTQSFSGFSATGLVNGETTAVLAGVWIRIHLVATGPIGPGTEGESTSSQRAAVTHRSTWQKPQAGRQFRSLRIRTSPTCRTSHMTGDSYITARDIRFPRVSGGYR
jgi:hypothetical protein